MSIMDAPFLGAFPAIDPSGIGIRFGDFHSKRMVQALYLHSPDGGIPVSSTHHNMLDERDRLIERLESLRRHKA